MRLRTGVKRERKKREARWLKKASAEQQKFLRDNVPRVLPGETPMQNREHCRVVVVGKLVPERNVWTPKTSKGWVYVHLPKMMGSRGTLIFNIEQDGYRPKFSKYNGDWRTCKHMELMTVFVPQECREKGNGDKLISKAMAIARENGVGVVWAETSINAFTLPFRILLHNHGFTIANWPDRQGNAIFEKILGN